MYKCEKRYNFILLSIYAHDFIYLRLALVFYANEGTEPIHVHASKGDMECKYWLLVEEVEIREEFAYNLTPAARKEIKKIIYQHFDLIVDSWHNHFNR